jgi:hypothetical protein
LAAFLTDCQELLAYKIILARYPENVPQADFSVRIRSVPIWIASESPTIRPESSNPLRTEDGSGEYELRMTVTHICPRPEQMSFSLTWQRTYVRRSLE